VIPERAFVVGMGEVGRRLGSALGAAGVEVVPVTRDVGWDALDAGSPLLLCVREEALPPLLERLRGTDPARLVLVQNGWIRPLLGGIEGCTRGLIWFTSKGEFFRVLRASPFRGPLAAPLAAALGAGGIAAAAVSPAAFDALDAEKMGFNCVVGLPLAVHGVALGEYLERHAAEAEALFRESTETCARALGVAADPEWWPAFLAACAPLGWVRASAAKALEYRSGAVLRLARAQGVAVPATERLLSAAGFVA
jgi:ketopantoate reductase